MKSLAFPNIFSASVTNIIKDKEAAKQNLKLTLASQRAQLFGDPFFGSNLSVRYMFEQNSRALSDIIAQEIDSLIKIYVPQILTNSKNIDVKIDKNTLYINIKYRYILDQTVDTLDITLMEN